MNIEKQLLQQALDSILHGSIKVITEVDNYGNLIHREERVNDLRLRLVDTLARELAKSEGFKQALEKAFTEDVINKMLTSTIENMTWKDLPYDVKNRLEKKMNEQNLSVVKLKQTLEVVDKE